MGAIVTRPCCPTDLPIDVTVCALQEQDWADVRRIYGEGIATGNATFETEIPSRRMLESKWLSDHRWVAVVDGQVAGWAGATSVSTRECYSGVAETSVYVGDGFRGRGVGKTLLHKQVTAADEAGLWTLQAAIFPENRAGIALHHSAGYRTVGVRERITRHHGVWRDTVMLERRADSASVLTPPDANVLVTPGSASRRRIDWTASRSTPWPRGDIGADLRCVRARRHEGNGQM